MLTLLEDEAWSQWSNCEIARQCHVAEGTVRKAREDLSSQKTKIASESRTVQRNGTVYQQNTTSIGRKKASGKVRKPGGIPPSAPGS